MSERRICIVGTAPTWRDAPWGDPSVEMWLLNDMWLLNPSRADRWYDLHPFDKFHYSKVGKKQLGHQVPAGYFVRPEGHLDALRRMTIPVYVQDAAQLGSPNAVTFPKAEVEKSVGPYFASSPAWMVGHAIAEGATEIQIFGIHLATDWEYLKQKPNMSFLLGVAAGKGIKVIVPKTAPLIRESHQYAYQADPDLPRVAIKKRIQDLEQQLGAIEKQLAVRRWWKRVDPNLVSRKAWLQAQIMDAQYALASATADRSPIGV